MQDTDTQEAVEVLTGVQLPEQEAEVNSDYLVECVVRAQDYASTQNAAQPVEGFDPMVFPPKLNSPFIWVARRHKPEEKVNNVNDLLELLCDLTDLKQVTTYSGWDHQKVFVLTGKIPHKWVASVRNVMLKDVPARQLQNVKVVEMFNKHKNQRNRKVKLVLRGTGGIPTDSKWEEIPASRIEENYNILTMKICRESHRMLAWFPGMDVHSNVCAGLDGMFVELSPFEAYLTKAQRAPAAQQKQHVQARLTLKDLQ